MPVPQFRQIDFGEIDANAEHVLAQKRKIAPIYERAFVPPPITNLDKFVSQEKFLISGQKGTGKSAVLRHLEATAKAKGYATDYIIFKDNILEESDLYDEIFISSISERRILETRHYLHIIKRILLLKFIYLLMQRKGQSYIEVIQERVPFLSGLVDFFKESDLADVTEYAFRSALDLAKSLKLPGADSTTPDFAKLLKGQNETLMKAFVAQAEKAPEFNAIVFLDEIHFAFKDKESFRQDAMLVRDCISAALNLNVTFITKNINCCVQLAVRSEFLEHPVIAQAEIQNQIHAYGEPMDWSSEKYDRQNPLWKFVMERVRVDHPRVQFAEFFANYVGNDRPELLLEHTWSKPRDLVRFFNVAKRRFPGLTHLDKRQFDTVVKEYSIEAWREHRTALSSFLNEAAITVLEEFLGNNSYRNYTLNPFPKKEIQGLLSRIKIECDGAIDEALALNLLYVLGVFQMQNRLEAQIIYNSYHRANLQPKWDWEIYLHPAIAKRFS